MAKSRDAIPAHNGRAPTLDLDLTGMAYGGEAFGRDQSGRIVFVPFALPGERVRLVIQEEHTHWARGRIVDILRPAPERVLPRCRHFSECGGCHYQHLDYPAQVRHKASIVGEQLARLGGFANPPVLPAVASPSPWNTRNHVQFSQAPDGRLGFQAAASHRTLAIQECHLPEPRLADLWPRLNLEPIPGLQRIGLRAGDDECMIVFEGGEMPEVELETDLPDSVVWLTQETTRVLAGAGALSISVLDRTFQVSAASFFQVHTELAGMLVRCALEALAIQPGETVLDLYAGVGLFSAFIAQRGAHLIAVEQSPSACADFQVNLDEFDSVELYAAPVEAALPALRLAPHAALVDPPRSGLDPLVVQALTTLGPERLVYVSCDPATLARDGKCLTEAGYSLRSVTPIDLFPQTYHIETVSLWQR
jgi:23S rRNA (uracil1939-C5)-methyltransferase